MKRSKTLNAQLLTASLMLANCSEPQPVLMTEQNRPQFTSRGECAKVFGEENCRTGISGGGAHPVLLPVPCAWTDLLLPDQLRPQRLLPKFFYRNPIDG